MTVSVLLYQIGFVPITRDINLGLTPANRFNYILWLQDVVRAHEKYIERPDVDVYGIDIGTGASAIYPLLGCSAEGNWKFVATELDETSFSYAKRNIELNGLTERIHLIKTANNDPILSPLELYPTISFDFIMCNPPFYESTEEMASSAIAKELPPNAVCTGAEVEMITPGGELGFLGQMVGESVRYRNRCRWYTSMLGKFSSVLRLVKLFRESTISNYAVTEFVQGQTRRWAIAWSFSDVHLPDIISRISNTALQPYLPQRNTLNQIINLPLSSFPHDVITYVSRRSVSALMESLSQIVNITVEQRSQGSPSSPTYFTIYATQNTWSRSARRRALQREHDQQSDQKAQLQAREVQPPAFITSSTTPAPSSFACGIELKPPVMKNEDCTIETELIFQWMYGQDRAMFESFASHVTKKVRIYLLE
ncbi:hypothetical protein AX15_002830 [Amanita polypyramis BW_CC]|nr:hypothetical protein AX15_002830 [Amanita polypyramis BW_CC]